MTVCLAALASDNWGIICIADRALSYGGYFQWDSDSSKMFHLSPSGAIVMFSGSEDGTSRVIAKLLAREAEIGRTIPETITICEQEYKAAVDELVEAHFLRPRLLTRQEYIAGISGHTVNSYFRAVAKDIHEYKVDCSLIVCGFDMTGPLPRVPYILCVEHPGIVTDLTRTGFHAIGSGWDKAISHLLFDDYKRSHGLGRVLYQVFDAKAHAELDANVGYEWDAKIVRLTSREPHGVPKHIKDLIEQVWSKYNRSPFEKREKDDLAPPPRDWQARLEAYGAELMTPKAAAQASSQT